MVPRPSDYANKLNHSSLFSAPQPLLKIETLLLSQHSHALLALLSQPSHAIGRDVGRGGGSGRGGAIGRVRGIGRIVRG